MASGNASLRLKLRPDLVEEFPVRASAFGLATSTLLAILVWNDALRPNRALIQIDPPAKEARAPLSCSLRASQRAMARRRAREQGVSLNAYLEALIEAHLAAPVADLVVGYRGR